LFEALEEVKEAEKEKIMYWNKSGTEIVVNETQFEERVMVRHPGLVQTNSYRNLRRQLLWYEFKIIGKIKGCDRWSHPAFQRGRKDLLVNVQPQTKSNARKSVSNTSTRSSSSDSATKSMKRLKKPKISDDYTYDDFTEFNKHEWENMYGAQDASTQTNISMETFCRLDPRDFAVTALLVPGLAALVDGTYDITSPHIPSPGAYSQQLQPQHQQHRSPVQIYPQANYSTQLVPQQPQQRSPPPIYPQPYYSAPQPAGQPQYSAMSGVPGVRGYGPLHTVHPGTQMAGFPASALPGPCYPRPPAPTNSHLIRSPGGVPNVIVQPVLSPNRAIVQPAQYHVTGSHAQSSPNVAVAQPFVSSYNTAAVSEQSVQAPSVAIAHPSVSPTMAWQALANPMNCLNSLRENHDEIATAE
jgi:hypothetical protein